MQSLSCQDNRDSSTSGGRSCPRAHVSGIWVTTLIHILFRLLGTFQVRSGSSQADSAPASGLPHPEPPLPGIFLLCPSKAWGGEWLTLPGAALSQWGTGTSLPPSGGQAAGCSLYSVDPGRFHSHHEIPTVHPEVGLPPSCLLDSWITPQIGHLPQVGEFLSEQRGERWAAGSGAACTHTEIPLEVAS